MTRLSSRPAGRIPFPFCAFIAAAGGKILVFFRPAAGPIDHHALDAVPFFQAERHRKFRLRQVTGAAFHQPRLRQAASERRAPWRRSRHGLTWFPPGENGCCDSREFIVAIQVSRAIVGSEQQIKIAVAIKIRVGQTAADFRLIEASADLCRDFAKASLATDSERVGAAARIRRCRECCARSRRCARWPRRSPASHRG